MLARAYRWLYAYETQWWKEGKIDTEEESTRQKITVVSIFDEESGKGKRQCGHTSRKTIG
jgi:hypothetical protein